MLRMNYIKEMNAFYTQLQFNPLSSSSIALWGTLMNINNSTGWKKEFTAAATLLRTIAGLSEGAFKRARIELQEKGYIIWRSRGGNQAAVYQMVSLSSLIDYKGYNEQKQSIEKAEIIQEDVQDATEDRSINNTSLLVDSSDTPSETIHFYQENFGGELVPFVKEDINTWVSIIGDALVLEAMQRAIMRGKGHWSYVRCILQAWKRKGIVTMDQAREEWNTNADKKQLTYKTYRNKAEVIPTWFKERHLQASPKQTQVPVKNVGVAALLEEFRRQKKEQLV